MPTPRHGGPADHGRDESDAERVVPSADRPRRGPAGGLGDARRYRPHGRTVREAADPAEARRRADRARRAQQDGARRAAGPDDGAADPVDGPRRAGDRGRVEPARSPDRAARADRRDPPARPARGRPARERPRPDPADGPARAGGSGRRAGARPSSGDARTGTRKGQRPAQRTAGDGFPGTGSPRRSGDAGTSATGSARRGARDRSSATGAARNAGRGRQAGTGSARRTGRGRSSGTSTAWRSGGTGRSTRGRGGRSSPRRRPPRRGAGLPGLLAGWGPGRAGGGRLARLGSPRRRLRLGTLVVLVLFTALAGRLVQLQLTDAGYYAEKALQQRLQTVPLPATRGAIVDRHGAVLADSVTARYVYADPTMIKDTGKAAAKLSPVLGIARSTLEHDMRHRKLPDGRASRFAYLARGVDISVGNRVAALGITGIGVRPDERRDVPNHDLAANIIGFTGYDGGGLTGLEAAYDDLLSGTDGQRQFEAGPDGQEIPDGFHREKKPQPGGSVHLTIDRDIQFLVQQALYDKLHKLGSDMGAAVVLDVRTGQVLAQASYPTYDAADPGDSTRAQRTDYASQAVVEPGSVHKVITIGAALQEGVIKPDSAIPINSTVTKGGTTYQDTHWHGKVRITVPGIFAYSSNVGTIAVADKLGADKLYAYQRKFGLGEPTGEGMPGEAAGIVRPASHWHGSDFGSIPIGLGVAATPIQLAAAYGAIANDGEYVQPHLIDRTVDSDGTVHRPHVSRHRVLSPKIARAERAAMVSVTTVPDATGTSGAVPGYRVAAKTGTGQRYIDGKKQSGNIESFIGMAPAAHPRYVVAVVAHTSGHGEGADMGPVFKQIMSTTLAHEKVPPPNRKTPTFTVYEK